MIQRIETTQRILKKIFH